MKITRLKALFTILSIPVLLALNSCKKNLQEMQANKPPVSQNSGLNQQGLNNPNAGKFTPQISKYFVNHTPNIIANDNDPHPIDCTVEAYTDIYALRVDCNGGNVLYYMDFIKIETNWASTSPNLIITVNGNTLTNSATYMGGEPSNHCLAYYQLQNVPSWELGVFDFCTPQTLNINYYDPVLNLSANETIVVGLSGCYTGSYQTQAWASSSTSISMALPYNFCICPGTSTIWPPNYTFRLEDSNGFVTDIQVPYVPYVSPPTSGYFAPTVFSGLAPGTYKIWGRNDCPGVVTNFVPGIPATITL